MDRTATRQHELQHMLHACRRELQVQVQSRMRDGRARRTRESGDDMDRSDATTQGDLDSALLQMSTERLARVDQALVRLSEGRYGTCVECDDDIAEARLRALPFAARCQACEAQREAHQGRTRTADREAAQPLFPGASGF